VIDYFNRALACQLLINASTWQVYLWCGLPSANNNTSQL